MPRDSRQDGFTLPYEWGELVEKAKQGNCVLFLGADAPNGYAQKVAPPCSSEIASILATKCEYSGSNLALPNIAQFYESRFQRNSLVDLVRSLYEGRPRYRPGQLHELIAKMPFSAIITTRCDTLLEESLQRADKAYEVVVSSADVPYMAADKVLILKLHGCITRPDSLVLTERDALDLHRRLPAVFELVRFFFATKHLLFLDYNLEDQEFKFLFHEVIQTVGIHHRRIYAVCPQYPSNVVTLWRDVSISLLSDVDSVTFLAELRKRFRLHSELPLVFERPQTPLLKPPYKFLDYFAKSDNDIFYGRDAETLYCLRRILSHTLVTIFGPSGAGKTSLLLAGVSPELEKEDYQLVFVRPFGDPLSAVKHAITQFTSSHVNADQPLVEILRTLLGDRDKMVLALDQFEEVFLSVSDQARQQFYHEVSETLTDTMLDVRFVIVLREDFLALLDEARKYLSTIFTNSYRITNLSHDQAIAAIVEPARRARMDIEPALLDKLLSDLDEGGVAPPQLQIICYQLYLDCVEQSRAKGKEGIDGETLLLERYEALGGSSQMLGDYLNRVLYEIEDTLGLIARSIAVEVLKVMVSSQQTKLALNVHEIKTSGRTSRIPAADLEKSLATLVDKRLMRRFERAGTAYFELAHDYLSRHVALWISEEEWAAKRIREMIMREMGNWREGRTLIPIERFRIIDNLREDISHLERDEAELLTRCAFEYGINYRYWLEHAVLAGWNIWDILDQLLLHPDPFVRGRAVECIGLQESSQAVEKLRELLQDRDVQVREVAVEQLEQIRAANAVPELIDLLVDDYPSVSWRAARALYTIRTYDALMALGSYWPRNMILIRAGTCLIGSTAEEVREHIEATGEDYFNNELPQHTVFIEDFLIDRFLVTNADYKKFVEATGSKCPSHWLGGKIPEGSENNPVSQIAWSEANAYAVWSGKRLPTDYEWEKAVGWDPDKQLKYRYPWGDTFKRDHCHVNIHPGRIPYVRVGSYSPHGDSPYGVADAIGNGWVWVDGIFGPYPGATYEDPHYGKGMHIQRSCGGWDNEATHTYHVTHRVGMPDVENAEVTFRCAISVVDYLSLAVEKKKASKEKKADD